MIVNVPTALFRPAVVVLVLAGLWLGVANVGASLRADDVWSRNAVELHWADLLSALKADVHPPLYFLLLKPLENSLGDGEWALRLPSIVLYWLSCVAMYRLARRFFDPNGSAVAVACYLTAPLAAQTAELVRMYSLLALIAILGTAVFLDLARGQASRTSWLLYAVLVAAGSFTHLWFFCLLAGHGLTALVWARQHIRSLAAAWAVGLLPYTVTWLPALVSQLQTSQEAAAWLKPPHWSDIPSLMLLWLGPSLLLLPWAIWAGRRQPDSPDVRRWAGTLLAGTLIPPLAVSVFKPFFYSRFTIVAVPLIALLVAGVLVRAARGQAGQVVIALAILGSALAFGYRPRGDACTARGGASMLLERARDGDFVIYTSLSRPAVRYYLDRARPQRRWVESSFPADIDSHPGYEGDVEASSRRTEMDHEAAGMAARFEQSPPGTKLYFFEGRHPALEALFKNKIPGQAQTALACASEGSYYRTISVFTR